jgi:Lrp/AsnC family transcriptional regulator for asnA, asnC and gidA
MAINEKINEKDKILIKLLQADGRLTDTEAAKQLDVSNDTARRMRERLFKTGVIRINAHIDPKKFGYVHILHLSLVAKPSVDTRKLADKFMEDKNVYYAALSLGPGQQILLHYRAKNRDELYNFIQKVRDNPKVESVSVNVIFDVLKAGYHSIDLDSE